jgi:hypothetical protein
MIDEKKYEGHQVSDFKTSVAGLSHSWVTHHHKLGAKDAMFVNHATAALVADAPLLLAEVLRLREELSKANKEGEAVWSVLDNWSMCEDDYTMHDQYENLDERYTYDDEGRLILKELYTYTEEDGWQPKEMIK